MNEMKWCFKRGGGGVNGFSGSGFAFGEEVGETGMAIRVVVPERPSITYSR